MKNLIHKKLVNNKPILKIDLSTCQQDEITEYLQALLAAKYALSKKGLKLKIQSSEIENEPKSNLLLSN